jgi:hypothetical protein
MGHGLVGLVVVIRFFAVSPNASCMPAFFFDKAKILLNGTRQS